MESFSPVLVILNTGIIINELKHGKETDLKELQIRLNLTDRNFYVAIGYLIKENKIEIADTEEGTMVSLNPL